jgi:hypothetical protein
MTIQKKHFLTKNVLVSIVKITYNAINQRDNEHQKYFYFCISEKIV